MKLHLRGIDMWFDVDGAHLRAEGPRMRSCPQVLLLHGGPGSYDHSYFKPDFGQLAEIAQVIYVDLRGHGRSTWGNPIDFTFEACADDLRALCEALGIERPIVFGHSLGGYIAATYAARHSKHLGALVLQSTAARFDLARIVERFGTLGGPAAATAAERFYRGDLTRVDEFRARCRPLFGGWVPGDVERSRIVVNPGLLEHGLAQMRAFDVLGQLGGVECDTLFCFGERDPMAQQQDGEELLRAMPRASVRLVSISGAGHFPWKENPEKFWPVIREVVASVSPHPSTSR